MIAVILTALAIWYIGIPLACHLISWCLRGWS